MPARVKAERVRLLRWAARPVCEVVDVWVNCWRCATAGEKETPLYLAVLPAHRGHRRRDSCWLDMAGFRVEPEAAGRRFHQADQDVDRADHLLHRGAGHRP